MGRGSLRSLARCVHAQALSRRVRRESWKKVKPVQAVPHSSRHVQHEIWTKDVHDIMAEEAARAAAPEVQYGAVHHRTAVAHGHATEC